jgi:hypothetical protein
VPLDGNCDSFDALKKTRHGDDTRAGGRVTGGSKALTIDGDLVVKDGKGVVRIRLDSQTGHSQTSPSYFGFYDHLATMTIMGHRMLRRVQANANTP